MIRNREPQEEEEEEEEDNEIQLLDEDYDIDDTNEFYDGLRETRNEEYVIPTSIIQFFAKELERIASKEQLRVAEKLRSIRTEEVMVNIPEEMDDIEINNKLVNYKTQLLIEQSFYDKKSHDTLVSKRIAFRVQLPFMVASSYNLRHPILITEILVGIVYYLRSTYDKKRFSRTCKLLYNHKLLR